MPTVHCFSNFIFSLLCFHDVIICCVTSAALQRSSIPAQTAIVTNHLLSAGSAAKRSNSTAGMRSVSFQPTSYPSSVHYLILQETACRVLDKSYRCTDPCLLTGTQRRELLPEHARQPQLHEALAPRLTAWERLFPASRHHERAKPSSCGGGTAGGRYLRYLPTAETRCS